MSPQDRHSKIADAESGGRRRTRGMAIPRFESHSLSTSSENGKDAVNGPSSHVVTGEELATCALTAVMHQFLERSNGGSTGKALTVPASHWQRH